MKNSITTTLLSIIGLIMALGSLFSTNVMGEQTQNSIYRDIGSPFGDRVTYVCTITFQSFLCSVMYPSADDQYYLDISMTSRILVEVYLE